MDSGPPPYDEATPSPGYSSAPIPTKSSSSSTSPDVDNDVLTYALDIDIPSTFTVATTPFPSPAKAWQARSVEQDDWDAFLAELSDDNRSEDIRKQRERVVQEWNSRFFGVRRCQIIVLERKKETPVDEESAEAVKDDRNSGRKVLGLKMGSKFGVGSKIANAMFGVGKGDAKGKGKAKEGADSN